MAVAIIVAVAMLNLRGFGPRRLERAALFVLADLLLQLCVVALGLALVFEPEVLTDPASIAGEPAAGRRCCSRFTLAIVAFTGLDASSGLAGQVAVGRRGLKRLIAVRVPADDHPLRRHRAAGGQHAARDGGLRPGVSADAPMLGIARRLRAGLAARAAALPDRRLGRGDHADRPATRPCSGSRGSATRWRSTARSPAPSAGCTRGTRRPYVVIAVGTVLAIALVYPADLEFLAGIYALGATIAFTLVTLGVCVLRWREPARDRPYKMPLNLRIGRAELPLPAALGRRRVGREHRARAGRCTTAR